MSERIEVDGAKPADSGPVDVLAVLGRVIDGDDVDTEVELMCVRAAVAKLIKALAIAVRQNSHDMLMTGEELRVCEAALSNITGATK